MSAEPTPSRCRTDRPAVSDLTVDGSGRRFTLTFEPGQLLPDHRHPSRLEFRVLEGAGELLLGGATPLALAPEAHFQLDPELRHAVMAGPDGLVLEVRAVTPDCECC